MVSRLAIIGAKAESRYIWVKMAFIIEHASSGEHRLARTELWILYRREIDTAQSRWLHDEDGSR